MHFLIPRTDNIGDVILTFPMAAKLKEYFPDCTITLLARHYTEDIVRRCADVDYFLAIESLHEKSEKERVTYLKSLQCDVFIPSYPNQEQTRWAAKAEIPIRVGHLYRTYYLYHANRMIWRIKRKRSPLHQVQLCLQFFKGLHLPHLVTREELPSLIRLKSFVACEKARALIDPQTFNLVLHPGTNGNTQEWPKDSFAALMRLVPPHVKVFVTGSAKEKEKYADLLSHHPNATGVFGDLTLSEFTDFLSLVDGVVVGSTGPLHLSAALGKPVIGLFPAQPDLNVARWGALGKNAINIEAPTCGSSRKGEPCECMLKITPEQVYAVMQENWGL